MAQDEDEQQSSATDSDDGGDQPVRRLWPRPVWIALALLVPMLVFAWVQRDRIADNLISGQLERLGLPARYEIESIGPDRQVLRHIVIGDPNRPDLTIERLEAQVEGRLGLPGISRITLVKPRLYGSYREGKLSFGSLDPLIFTDSKEPFSLPDFHLAIVDGRGLIESEYGPVGLKLQGAGELRDGFAGEMAAIAPALQAAGCTAQRVSLYGELRTAKEKPRFTGPLRIGRLACAESGLRLANAGLQADAVFDKALDGGEGRLEFSSGPLGLQGSRIGALRGTSRFTFRKRALTARYSLSARNIATPQALATRLGLEGHVRGSGNFARIETEGSVSGKDLRLAAGLDASLAQAAKASEGTLAAPALAQLRTALVREGRGSRLSASYVLRRSGEGVSLVVPSGALRGGKSGQALLSLSRFQLGSMRGKGSAAGREPDGTSDAALRIAGNFATGGPGLPRIAGRIERASGTPLTLHFSMPEYRAGSTRLALPELALAQQADGTMGFSGLALLSGDLPGGGHAENLRLPLEGGWSPDGGLSLWRKCVELRFDALAVSSLSLDRRRLPLCPPKNGAIVRSGTGGLRIAAGMPALDLTGTLGETPIRIASGPVGFAWPGTLAARAVDVTLGPAEAASRFHIARLDARTGGEVAGTFSGSEIRLNAVPLDLLETAGNWRIAGGVLTIADAAFRLQDREPLARFQPLAARDGTLVLADNVITAGATLREPTSDREVVRTAIRHALGPGEGHAELFVDGVQFDDRLQPDMLTREALGIVANAKGVVRGSGRIDWDAQRVTSGGKFSTDSLDFAAAFGPVEGVSGTVVFTDLLGLVTARDQSLRIAHMNPGIEVEEGTLGFEMRPNNTLRILGGSWPFLDGRLILHPATMNIGVAEVRHYTLEVEGIDAARFVEKLELGNLAATGTFDGLLPLVFDENGGRIEGGQLQSRPPGGNVSYIGQLTYKDLSAMANFAFQALRSLNYSEMTIGMDGSLEGEVITRVRFRGVGQGDGATRNFLTKQVAKLPLQFDVNLRAPFFQLITSFKSLYDPAFVRDPRTLGLLDAQGRPRSTQSGVTSPPVDTNGSVQPMESGNMP